MSTAARWSLRLPRASTRFVGPRTGTRNAVRRVEQRRWVQRPPRARPWASQSQKGNEQSSAIQSSQQGDVEQGQNQQQQRQQQQIGRNTQLATTLAQSSNPDLISSVHIPTDPHSVIPPSHPALSLLGNSSLVIQRQLEMMNVMLGFEQANRYIIMDGHGQTLGYIAEQDHGLGSAMVRQLFRTHRSFTTHIFDEREREMLRIHRPFAYINSRIRIYDPVPEGGYGEGEEGMEGSAALRGTSASSVVDSGAVAKVSPLKLEEMRIIGEAQQQWAPLRRKYDLFTYRPLDPAVDDSNATPRIESGDRPTTETTALTENKTPDRAIEAGMSQFAHVNEPFLSWDFTLRSENNDTIGSVNRNFSGFAREIFTDTGVYALRMDSAAQSTALESADGSELDRYERDATAMTLDQRAVMLATAVSIDFDYFSRHSGVGHGGFMPLWWPMGGGAAEGGAAGAGAGAAGEAGAGTAVGAVGEGAVGAAGRGVTSAGAGAAESGIAGAGTMAGYEAMQRGVYGSPRSGGADDANPQAGNHEPFAGASGGPEQTENHPGNDDVWGEDQDPWGGGGGGGAPPPSAGGEAGGGEGGDGGGGGGWMDTISDFFGDS